ncbi:hypothetical protein ANN_22676 [Periplaneta americana]|uniref:Uncharacterized protein n=1 Tax=Periplaneta americana TaxID=6978 RepID=A0ABQ8S9F7_PERAM|nr:hypothetical protein ANN_22676 [Periplaneta americana]
MSNYKRVNTIRITFETSATRSSAIEIHHWLSDKMQLKPDQGDTIQLNSRERCIYLKVISPGLYDKLLQTYDTPSDFRYESGETTKVTVSAADTQSITFRFFNLPPEVPHHVLRNVLSNYGSVLDIGDEQWSTQYLLPVNNSVQAIRMELKQSIPTSLKIANYDVNFSHPGQNDEKQLKDSSPAEEDLGETTEDAVSDAEMEIDESMLRRKRKTESTNTDDTHATKHFKADLVSTNQPAPDDVCRVESEEGTSSTYQPDQGVDQPTPQQGRIDRLMERFKTAGSIHDKKRSGRPRIATGDPNAASVLAKLVASPSRSTREVAKECGTSQASVPRILSVTHFHPYRMPFVQELHGDVKDMRVQFCEWFLERRTHQPNLEADICWSNEACFHFNGTMNSYNAVYWATENHHIAVEAHNRFDSKLNVWCGIHWDVVIGPVFLNNKLTAPVYR